MNLFFPLSFPASRFSSSRSLRTGLLAALLTGSAVSVTFAQEKPDTDAKAEAKAAAEEKAASLPPFKDVVKGMKASSAGLFTLYTNDLADPTKEPSRIIGVIPAAMLGKDLMLATSISRGDNMGFPVGTDLIQFQISGNKMMIAVPDVRMKQSPDKPVTNAVENTYTPSFLAALPILSKTDSGDMAVDLTPFFSGAAQYASPFAGMRGMGREPAQMRYTKIKTFPDNVLVDVDVAFASTSGAGQSIGVGYSFRRLPDAGSNDYKPRIADERVGYFTTVRQDWNLPYSDRETLVRYANRWDLKKKDPSLDISPPTKPITFIIEKSVPLQWRRFVKEGIEEWNKAYEAIGITGAIVVQQQTDDNEFAKIDPEDARYNFFRWIVTGGGFAMGPSRPDPRTGEILDADIIFDDAMVRYQIQDWQNFLGPEALASMMGPEVVEFLEANPAYIPIGMDRTQVAATAERMRNFAQMASGESREMLVDSSSISPNAAPARRPLSHPNACTYAQGMQQKMMTLHSLAAASAGRKVPERLLGEMIKDIVSHEVGHTLGLRHNFKGSTWLTADEIKKRRDSGNDATFATTMDYNDILVFPGDKIETIKHITSPVIGPYDMWAIEYGYKQLEGDEKEALNKIAGRTNEPGLAYATDEDVMGLSSPDPGANRWDMSSDPLAWAQQRAKLADEMLATFQAWAVKPDEPASFLRGSFLNLMSDKSRPLLYVARVVGGQSFSRNRPGDANAVVPLRIVPAAEQRKALDLLGSTIFSDEFLKVDPELLNKLVASRNDDGRSDPSARIDFPVHQAMLNLQSISLLPLTNPITIQRVYDAEMKTPGDDKFTAAELIDRTQKLVWGDTTKLGTADAKVNSVRRNLQTQWLNNMVAVAKQSPGTMVSPDVVNMVRYSLRQLATDIGENKSTDLGTRAHLSEAKSRIERVLNAPEIDVNVEMPFIIMMSGRPVAPAN